MNSIWRPMYPFCRCSWVWLDKHLNLKTHVNKIVSHCYKLLKDIGRIRSVLSQKHTETLVHAVTSSRLDYCNSIFYNMNKSNLFKLQKVQNAAARLIVQKRRRESITSTIRELHWLRIESRILFKILLLVYKWFSQMWVLCWPHEPGTPQRQARRHEFP